MNYFGVQLRAATEDSERGQICQTAMSCRLSVRGRSVRGPAADNTALKVEEAFNFIRR